VALGEALREFATEHYPDFLKTVSAGIQGGNILYREDITEGFENAPTAPSSPCSRVVISAKHSCASQVLRRRAAVLASGDIGQSPSIPSAQSYFCGTVSMLLPFALCAAGTSSCMTSQCSAILPLATRNISTAIMGLGPHPK
jgi:hypothetical protein